MIIDIHAYYCPPVIWQALGEGRFGEALRAGREPDGGLWWESPRRRARGPAALADLRQRLLWMNEQGVDVQVLSPWPAALAYELTGDPARRYHQEWNRALARAVDSFPERLQFLATIPLYGGQEALAVLDDAVNRLGAVGVAVGVDPAASQSLADPALDPVWAAVADLAIPVVLVPIPPPPAAWTLGEEWALPAVVAAGAAALATGGVLDRHPLLDVVLTFGGGLFPWQSPNAPRFYYDCAVPAAEWVRWLAQAVGESRLLLGTGHPLAADGARGLLQAALGAEAATRVQEDNPTALFARL
jgi:aminocarboxymuconate-semialdehyde decarboxylase